MTDARLILPPFTETGVLPPSDYVLTLEQLRDSLLVAGPDQSPHWDELEFPSAFRQTRHDGQPKGIVKIGVKP